MRAVDLYKQINMVDLLLQDHNKRKGKSEFGISSKTKILCYVLGVRQSQKAKNIYNITLGDNSFLIKAEMKQDALENSIKKFNPCMIFQKTSVEKSLVVLDEFRWVPMREIANSNNFSLKLVIEQFSIKSYQYIEDDVPLPKLKELNLTQGQCQHMGISQIIEDYLNDCQPKAEQLMIKQDEQIDQKPIIIENKILPILYKGRRIQNYEWEWIKKDVSIVPIDEFEFQKKQILEIKQKDGPQKLKIDLKMKINKQTK